MDSDLPKEIFKGTRNDSFKRLIIDLLKRGNLRQKYIDSLTDMESLQQYDKAFTAPSANPEENYEIFEQLGDLSINKFIVWYAYRRFPQLDCPPESKLSPVSALTMAPDNLSRKSLTASDSGTSSPQTRKIACAKRKTS